MEEEIFVQRLAEYKMGEWQACSKDPRDVDELRKNITMLISLQYDLTIKDASEIAGYRVKAEGFCYTAKDEKEEKKAEKYWKLAQACFADYYSALSIRISKITNQFIQKMAEYKIKEKKMYEGNLFSTGDIWDIFTIMNSLQYNLSADDAREVASCQVTAAEQYYIVKTYIASGDQKKAEKHWKLIKNFLVAYYSLLYLKMGRIRGSV